MACNCGVSKNLDKFYKSIGEIPNNGEPKDVIKIFFIKNFARLIIIFTLPLLFLYISNQYRMGNNKISFKDFFGLDNIEYNTNYG